jgi:hypothetical protein
MNVKLERMCVEAVMAFWYISGTFLKSLLKMAVIVTICKPIFEPQPPIYV